jgi:hypothetical protein
MEHKHINSAVTHKKRKCGIVYISTLPPHMNVTKIREIFSLYGDIGRIFLQPADAGTTVSPGECKYTTLEHVMIESFPFLTYCAR